MTLEQWRGDKGLVSWAVETFNSPQGQELLKMLEESHIRHFQKPSSDPSQELGKIYGYDTAINSIVKASDYEKPAKGLGPATFQEPGD